GSPSCAVPKRPTDASWPPTWTCWCSRTAFSTRRTSPNPLVRRPTSTWRSSGSTDMAILEVNKNPTRRELIVFGLLFLVFAGIVGSGLYFRSGAHQTARVVWIGGAALSALYFLIPALRKPFYLGWLYLTFPIGFVLSHVI